MADPYVSTVEELHEIVALVRQGGEFAFDVETRGNIDRHPDVQQFVEQQWQGKLAELKTTHPGTLERSKQAIEESWRRELALDPLRNEVFWIGIAIAGRSWAIPMGHPNGEVLVEEDRGIGETVPPEGYRRVLESGKESMARSKYFIPATFTPAPPQLTAGQVFEVLETLFLDPDIIKINQNIKFDCKSVAKYLDGALPAGTYIDLQVLMHIADENLRNYKLETILDKVFKCNPYAQGGKLGGTITTEPFSKACHYVHLDVRWPWLAYKKLFRQISAVPSLLSALYLDIPLTRVLAQMEMNGVLINRKEMNALDKELSVNLNATLAQMGQWVPVGFNPDSTMHKAQLLFAPKKEGGLGLKSSKMTDTGRHSVDEDSLTALVGKHPVIELLLQHAEIKKMKSTYVENVPVQLHNGRLHPQFHMHRTKTGRLSASGPNLQNIPRDGRVRSLFIAEDGNHLVVADYSQIEMRVMGMYSQDPELLRIFQNGIDAHLGTAQVILGRDPESSEERNIYGKTPNFLLAYGGQAKKLVTATNGKITLAEGERIVKAYESGYAKWTSWKADLIVQARRRGYVETMGGRRRRVGTDALASEDWKIRWGAERQAINAVIQGTAAEICKEAMIALDKALLFPKCRILLQVHDELVISVPEIEVGELIPVIEKAMGNGRTIRSVPVTVEAHSATSWAGAK